MWKFFKKRVITRMDDGNQIPYLIRWNLFECPWFSIKIHRILISDDGCLHDHPWSFISFILWGGYVEERALVVERGLDCPEPEAVFVSTDRDQTKIIATEKRVYGAGSILWRPANSIHRLDVYQGALTLVLTFKKVKEWGFFTRTGWIPWFKYSPQNRC